LRCRRPDGWGHGRRAGYIQIPGTQGKRAARPGDRRTARQPSGQRIAPGVGTGVGAGIRIGTLQDVLDAALGHDSARACVIAFGQPDVIGIQKAGGIVVIVAGDHAVMGAPEQFRGLVQVHQDSRRGHGVQLVCNIGQPAWAGARGGVAQPSLEGDAAQRQHHQQDGHEQPEGRPVLRARRQGGGGFGDEDGLPRQPDPPGQRGRQGRCGAHAHVPGGQRRVGRGHQAEQRPPQDAGPPRGVQQQPARQGRHGHPGENLRGFSGWPQFVDVAPPQGFELIGQQARRARQRARGQGQPQRGAGQRRRSDQPDLPGQGQAGPAGQDVGKAEQGRDDGRPGEPGQAQVVQRPGVERGRWWVDPPAQQQHQAQAQCQGPARSATGTLQAPACLQRGQPCDEGHGLG